MIAGAAVSSRVIQQLIVGVDLTARQAFLAHVLFQRWRYRTFGARETQSADHCSPIGPYRTNSVDFSMAGMSPGLLDLAST